LVHVASPASSCACATAAPCKGELFYDATGRVARVTDSATGQVRYRVAPDFEWNATTNRAQIRISLVGNEIAVHDTAYDPNAPVGCSGTPVAALGSGDPTELVVLCLPGFTALLGMALLQARRRPTEPLYGVQGWSSRW